MAKKHKLYTVLRAMVKPLVWGLFRIKIEGKEQCAHQGRMLVAANHTCMMDAVILGCAYRQQLRFMGKKELFTNKISNWFFTALGAFPVDRGNSDTAAVAAAGKLLQAEEALMVFPEGTRNRSKTWQLGEFLNGASMIALRNDTPVLPVCITRRPRLFRKTVVVFGDPISPDSVQGEGVLRGEAIRRLTACTKERILQMYGAVQAEKGVKA